MIIFALSNENLAKCSPHIHTHTLTQQQIIIWQLRFWVQSRFTVPVPHLGLT